MAGWQGQAPTSIKGKTNPPLSLQPGTTYELTWVNLDGVEHELIIEDANGNELKATESASQKGATRTVTFTATSRSENHRRERPPLPVPPPAGRQQTDVCVHGLTLLTTVHAI